VKSLATQAILGAPSDKMETARQCGKHHRAYHQPTAAEGGLAIMARAPKSRSGTLPLDAIQPSLPFSEFQQWAAHAETRGVWPERRRSAYPLTGLPDSILARICVDVEQDHKPSQWLDLGIAQIPSRAWWEWHWQRGIDPEARRPAIPTWIRERVLARDGNVCQLCGGDVEPDDIHLDHIKPWSKGGEHSVDNLQVTHSLCNMRKAARWEPVENGGS